MSKTKGIGVVLYIVGLCLPIVSLIFSSEYRPPTWQKYDNTVKDYVIYDVQTGLRFDNALRDKYQIKNFLDTILKRQIVLREGIENPSVEVERMLCELSFDVVKYLPDCKEMDNLKGLFTCLERNNSEEQIANNRYQKYLSMLKVYPYKPPLLLPYKYVFAFGVVLTFLGLGLIFLSNKKKVPKQ